MTDVVVIGGIFQETLPPASAPVRRIGGSGFVAALTAAGLGAKVALVSYVGERDAQATLGPLRRAGVDTSAVVVLPGQSGIFSMSDLVDRQAPRPGYRPAEALPVRSDLAAPLPRAPVVLAFGFPDFDPFDWIREAVQPGGVFLWDRQGWLSRNINRLDLDRLPVERRIYVANLEEMRVEANRQTYAAALSEQPPAGFDSALIKCGRWGTLASDKDERIDFIPAFVSEVRSVIGSGDCFAGAVSARLAQGSRLGEAAQVGSAAASLFVERTSNIPAPQLMKGITEVLGSRERRYVSPVRLEKVRVYLAGPWFTAGEALLIDELEATLENLGLDVVSPRRDIGVLTADASAADILEVGRTDFATLDECDVLVAVLDGNDPGTLIEVGYAAKAKKPIIGLSSLTDVSPQPMREAAGVRRVTSIAGLVEEVTKWVRAHHGIG
jgi:sugar/nucleoside kinase (ribokinase family)/nucleoside 2-deoxyribosyltransferase